MTQQTYVARDGDTMDLIAWRVYGTQDGRLVEQLLDANPGMSGAATIPAGTLVQLPTFTAQPQQTAARLWD